jgi:carbohydrate-selective porin OprB
LPLLLPLQNGQGGEIYYKFNLTKWFALTPNLQVIQPGLANVDTSLAIGLRGKLTF